MFRTTTLSALGLIILGLAIVYVWHVKVVPQDTENYQKLLKESADLRSKMALEKQPAHQSRHRVQKDIWAIRGTERVHCRLKSNRSELEITQKKDKVEAVEHLESLVCWIQDHIDQQKQEQQVRMIKAETGTSYFPSYRFGTQNVEISFFRLPGAELPNSAEKLQPFLSGTAQEANFLTEFSLQGNVRLMSTQLQGKKSFAVSDKLVYHPQTQTLILSAAHQNRVLFWQEGLSLSAPRIALRRDPQNGVDCVEGLGDVRCNFSSEEKNLLEEIFSKYLEGDATK